MTGDFPANPIEKAGYQLEFNDEFDGRALDLNKWIPFYLPQWSSRKKATARYSFRDNNLVLRIDEDQQPWCPEFDGDVKCSSLQTGLYSGDVGSRVGQHRFTNDCIVREAQPTRRTYTPTYGYFETRMKVNISNNNLAALWLIGFETTPEESGEITMFEVFGDRLKAHVAEVRYGIKPLNDPMLVDSFYQDNMPISARNFHIYAIEWTPTQVDFYLDNRRIRSIDQSPNYPMQFMINVYELPGKEHDTMPFPKEFIIDYFRAYQPVEGY